MSCANYNPTQFHSYLCFLSSAKFDNLIIVSFTTNQGCQFRTVSAGTTGIYRTGQQSGTFDPLFRTGKNTGRTGQFRAIPAGIEKSFFFFFFKFCNF